MNIHYIQLFLCLLINVLVTATNNSNRIDEFAEVSVDEDYEVIQRFKALKKRRFLKLNSEYHNRIVGGKDSSVLKHPYVVSLQHVEALHICGGSIIHKWWVLTASHCITKRKCLEEAVCKGENRDILKDPRELVIFAGSSDPKTAGQYREIIRLVKHPSFSRPLMHNDIALIKVKNPFVFNKEVNLIHLPKISFLRGREIYHDYRECTALGWGARKRRSGKPLEELSEQERLEIEDDGVSPNLREVDLPVIPLKLCQGLINTLFITNRHVCTLYAPGGRDACEGDSGGPLVCEKNNVTLQFGITSWGHGCAMPRTPAVFTRTDTYYDWIHRVISGGPNADYYNNPSNKIVCTKWLLFVHVICNNNIIHH